MLLLPLLFGKDDEKTAIESVDGKNGIGTVIRLAGRKYNATSSKPSSREYTTQKDILPFARVSKEGVQGDYNHYRTVALSSTEDRAVSILTTDVMTSIRATYKNYSVQEGDLGENILIDGVSFRFFQVGQQYRFQSMDDETRKDESVIVEITEPIEPCANLCKLSYINDDSISPKDRIERCKEFIEHLDAYDGYRGWYAKVVKEGTMKSGSQVSKVDDGRSRELSTD
jgi:MOSC domain-containing protein YiiM